MSLERSTRCPKCNFVVEQVFPNFLCNYFYFIYYLNQCKSNQLFN